MTDCIMTGLQICRRMRQRATSGQRRTTEAGRAASYEGSRGRGSFRRAGQPEESGELLEGGNKLLASYWCIDTCAGLLVYIYSDMNYIKKGAVKPVFSHPTHLLVQLPSPRPSMLLLGPEKEPLLLLS